MTEFDEFAMRHGQLAFLAYKLEVGGKTHDGQVIPTWDELSEETQRGWAAAATAAGRVSNAIQMNRAAAAIGDLMAMYGDAFRKTVKANFPVPVPEEHDIEDEGHLKECDHPECIKARNQ